MEQKDREGRDVAGVGPYAREREKLVPMSTLESWTVSEGEPDIRGWEIKTVSGRQLGTVSDLLVDAEAREVVLLDVDLPGTDDHTFVPIRVVHLDRGKRVVLMDSADLPTTTVARPDTRSTDRRGSDTETVRYPVADREVSVQKSRTFDDAVRNDSAGGGGDGSGMSASSVERRREDRRRIERMSTEF
jgi:hypothetical protein